MVFIWMLRFHLKIVLMSSTGHSRLFSHQRLSHWIVVLHARIRLSDRNNIPIQKAAKCSLATVNSGKVLSKLNHQITMMLALAENLQRISIKRGLDLINKLEGDKEMG